MRLQKLSCPNVQCVPESCIKVNSTQKKLYLVVKRAVYNMPIHSTFEAYQIIFRASVNTANIQSSSQNRSRSNLPTMKSKTIFKLHWNSYFLQFLLGFLFPKKYQELPIIFILQNQNKILIVFLDKTQVVGLTITMVPVCR